MSMLDRLRARWPKTVAVQGTSTRSSGRASAPTYRDAEPAIIDAALERSQRTAERQLVCVRRQRRDPQDARSAPSVGGVEIVAWRDADGTLHVGPGDAARTSVPTCRTGTVDCGALICPWHGLRLAGGREFGWKPYPAHDDGVLAWVRLDGVGGEEPTDAADGARHDPTARQLHAVTRLVGTCEPCDIIANRLDPWHGAWFHPYSFARLEVLSAPPAGRRPTRGLGPLPRRR